MKHLVIGLGEVGSAIKAVLECDGVNQEKAPADSYEMLHICFPYSDKFVDEVKAYKTAYKAFYVVVHSTVPLYTCDDEGWIHSPVRGVHPNLEDGVRTFTKYFGGINSDVAGRVFVEKGIEVVITTKAATTEALKLWDTTQYGVMIALEKEIYAYCERHGLDFYTVYEHANRTYNDGYTKLGKDNVVRPYLQHMDGPIGGHCVIPNAKILREQETSSIMKMLQALIESNHQVNAQTE